MLAIIFTFAFSLLVTSVATGNYIYALSAITLVFIFGVYKIVLPQRSV